MTQQQAAMLLTCLDCRAARVLGGAWIAGGGGLVLLGGCAVVTGHVGAGLVAVAGAWLLWTRRAPDYSLRVVVGGAWMMGLAWLLLDSWPLAGWAAGLGVYVGVSDHAQAVMGQAAASPGVSL